jgi:ATP-dependent RNA helicase RhlE
VQGTLPPHPLDHRQIRCLVLTPTRELAAQVEESIQTYGKHLPHLDSAVVFGGVGFQPQAEALARGVDVLVATPGRLLDHVEQKTLELGSVEILVLDEADRMLDMGFIPAVRRILALLPAKRQNLLFSATFPDEIRKLAQAFMHEPVTVEVARRNTPAELVAQVVHPVDAHRKRELLAHLVRSNDWRQVLVFTRTKHGANRLAEQLAREGIEADAIHGNKSQGARTRALARFKANELRVLVATDIAARGLDIELLPHVVNYDLPHVPEDYVHRIGRTGRAGAEGEAVSFVSSEERPLLAAIERLMHRTIEEREAPGFEPGLTAPPVREQPPRGPHHGQPRRDQRQRPEQGAQRPRGPRPQGRDARSEDARGDDRGNRIGGSAGGSDRAQRRDGGWPGQPRRAGRDEERGGRGNRTGGGRPGQSPLRGGRGHGGGARGPAFRDNSAHASEREAQLREARRLMQMEQAESRPAQTAALLGGKRGDDE